MKFFFTEFSPSREELGKKSDIFDFFECQDLIFFFKIIKFERFEKVKSEIFVLSLFRFARLALTTFFYTFVFFFFAF